MIRADPERLDAAASRLRGALEGIRAELDALASEAGRLRGQWSGQARDAFEAAHTRWDAQLRVLADVLGQAVEALEEASRAAADADRAAAALW